MYLAYAMIFGLTLQLSVAIEIEGFEIDAVEVEGSGEDSSGVCNSEGSTCPEDTCCSQAQCDKEGNIVRCCDDPDSDPVGCANCPKCVDCTWAPWTECKLNTKPRTAYRTRKIVQEAKFGGKECGGRSKQECKCEYTEWSDVCMKNNRDCDNRSCDNREVQTRQIKNETEDTFFGYECKDFTKDCEIQHCYDMGIQYTGTPIASNLTSNVTDVKECQELCMDEEDCMKFTWNGTNCQLLNSTDGSEDNDEYTSGPKFCLETTKLNITSYTLALNAGGEFRLKTETVCTTEGIKNYISGYQKDLVNYDECKVECEKYDWCRGFRVKEKNTISCRLLTNKYAEMEGWTLFNKGNWVEPENWRGSIWANASNSHYKCYEKVGSGTTTSLESENGVEADEDQKMDENDDANEEVEVNEGIEDGNSNSTTTKPST